MQGVAWRQLSTSYTYCTSSGVQRSQLTNLLKSLRKPPNLSQTTLRTHVPRNRRDSDRCWSREFGHHTMPLNSRGYRFICCKNPLMRKRCFSVYYHTFRYKFGTSKKGSEIPKSLPLCYDFVFYLTFTTFCVTTPSISMK
jgi:hypothetical protein